ncbi:sperm-tail PG-rich repeat-containing protein 2 isoform X2 [Narcine bancroftii]|uniref:sperm-tail PG-rich repeat-containing protein 2 isoform X2 n=1 Tax=Narcine bancroftii TaxID=1343680 RepID=UPI0038319425
MGNYWESIITLSLPSPTQGQMYDRAPRDTLFASALGSTGPAVGPASYNASRSKLQCTCKEGDGYAPFLSLTSRESVFIAPGALLAPGPQHYDVNPVQDHIKGGQSMKNREVRFKEVGANLPGPASYDVHPINFVEKVNKASKSRCMLVLSPAASAPSIPASNQSYGYEEAEDGVLSRHLPPSRDTSLGPAYYNPQNIEPYPTRQYKGVHFGNRTSKRMNFKIPLGPGPGTYDIQKDSTLNYENLNMKNLDLNRESYMPRYIDAVVQEEERKGFPGPAKYEIRGQFNEKTSLLNKYNPPHPPFLSQTKRFLPEKSTTPAPGWYNDPRTAFQSLRRISTKGKSPFGHNAVRFADDLRTVSEPGPGTYNIMNHTIARESQKKTLSEGLIRGGFGSTVPRLHSVETKQMVPSPADYKIKEIKNNNLKHKSSSFASLTERMPGPGAQDSPAPGSYEVQKSYEKTQARGPSTSAEFMCNSFLTTVPRNFNPIRQTADEPGPGAYKPVMKSTPKMALMVSKQPRFKEPIALNPGPGDYELSPAIMETLLKGTFNATLYNPLLNPPPIPRHPDPPLFQDL